MSNYRPELDNTIPLLLLTPRYDIISGVRKKTFPDVSEGILFFGSFKSYGGTVKKEKNVNSVYSIEDTATVLTWYRPDIKSECRVALAEDPSAIYDIINVPEDVNRRHQFLKFQVRRVKGGA